ncbi:hypothetical protein QFC22_005278 [Naganishia vaughanmartiniae]|uniref:Uncharacterized protein n=1 Tax=Naganishia vaughanmartiniae TaxID=1424756 RepID=A0ACC2WVP3_9TREE|nr:hypothetical protein QFC22_005278 [Naganishia vaughanmartiniae]
MSSSARTPYRTILRQRPRSVYPCCQTFTQRRAASESAWDPRSPFPHGPPKPAAQPESTSPVEQTGSENKESKEKAGDGRSRTTSASSASSSTGSILPKPRLDFKKITANAQAITLNAILRRAPVPRDTVFHITRLYETSLTLRRKIDSVKHKQRDIGQAIKAGGGPAAVEQAKKLKSKVGEYVRVLEETERELIELGLKLPNETFAGTPVGGEEHALELERFGPEVTMEEEARGADQARDHLTIAQYYEWLDTPASAIATGSSWPFLKSTLALLEQALVQYAMSVAVKDGWVPVVVPDVVKEDLMMRCGFAPRDEAQVGQTYYVTTTPPGTEDETPATTTTTTNLVLAATAEIPLAALSANKIIPLSALPLKYVGISHAFRAEAGARGADTRGLYRLHQFTKVELFAVTESDDAAEVSGGMMHEIVALQKRVVEGLGLSVRVLDMPTEELGAPAFRKIDMEAWMPGRGKWGEISSTSNCKDFQSRRLHIRHRARADPSNMSTPPSSSETLPFAHTLNGTCAAIPRLLVALVENGVILEDGRPAGIRLPSVLRRFWYAGDTVGQGEKVGRIEWV